MDRLSSVADIIAALEPTGLPVSTFAWPAGKAPSLPYIMLVPTESVNLVADGRTYARARRWDVELYMRTLDMDVLVAVEDALDAAGIAYPSSSVIQDESNFFALARIENLTLEE